MDGVGAMHPICVNGEEDTIVLLLLSFVIGFFIIAFRYFGFHHDDFPSF